MPPLQQTKPGLFIVLHAFQGLAQRPAGSIGPVILAGDVFGLIGSTLRRLECYFPGSRVGSNLLRNISGDLAQQH